MFAVSECLLTLVFAHAADREAVRSNIIGGRRLDEEQLGRSGMLYISNSSELAE